MARKPKSSGAGGSAGAGGNGGDGENGGGYGKPPRHSQFKPGQSGNPIGRRKGSRGLKTDLKKELAASHTIQINGRPVKGSRQQLMVMTLATRAASGDLKAIALLVPLVLQVFGIEDRGTGDEKLAAQDQALLDFMIGHRGEHCPAELDDNEAGGSPDEHSDPLTDPDELPDEKDPDHG